MATTSITLRPARRSDIPRLADIANAANAGSRLHRRMAPGQDEFEGDYRQWRLAILRERFATPSLRTMVAEDASTNTILGFASFDVEGTETALWKRWTADADTWSAWLERKLISVEKSYARYVSDRSVDYAFMKHFFLMFLGSGKLSRPPCLHCHLIVVDPRTQAKGVGTALMDWAKKLAREEGLPVYLESNFEAVGFYVKSGFVRLGEDLVIEVEDGEEALRVPVFAWEGEERQGRYLEREGAGREGEERWRWRDDVLPPQAS